MTCRLQVHSTVGLNFGISNDIWDFPVVDKLPDAFLNKFNVSLDVFRCCTEFFVASDALAPELSSIFRKNVGLFPFEFCISMNTMGTR